MEQGSPLLGNLLRYEESLSSSRGQSPLNADDVVRSTPPSSGNPSARRLRVASLLFFQPHRFAPARTTRTKSMAAVHLTPQLLGSLHGIAWDLTSTSDYNDKVMASRLRDLGLKSNRLHGEWTGVSLVRWKDLIRLSPSLPSSGAIESSREDQSGTLLSLLWMSCLWEISTSKSDFLNFWFALEQEVPGLSLLNDSSEIGQAIRHGATARQE